MNRAGHQLLSGAAGAVDQHRTVAVRDHRQELEESLHRWTPADDVTKGIASLELSAQIFDQAEIAKGLDAADDLAVTVPEDGR